MVEGRRQIALLIDAWGDDLKRLTFGHPLIADLRQQVNVQLIGKYQSRLPARVFNAKANSRQLVDALRVIITGDQFGALPDPTRLMQPAPDGCRRDRDATLYLHLLGQRGATPARATPAVSRRRALEQRQQRAAQRRRQRTSAMRRLGIGQSIERASLISTDGAIDAGARAEQDGSNLSRRVASRAQQEDVEGEPVAITGAAEFKEQTFLLRARQINYGRTRHSESSVIDRLFRNYRNIKEQPTVPTSCILV